MPCDRVGCPNVAAVRVYFGGVAVSYYCRPCALLTLERNKSTSLDPPNA